MRCRRYSERPGRACILLVNVPAASLPRSVRPDCPASRSAVLGVSILTLGVGAMLQWLVYAHGGHALGDLEGRFRAWHLERGGWPYRDQRVEYPVIIGVLASLAARAGATAGRFAIVTGVGAAVAALAMALIMRPIAGERIWRWAVGVPLVLYAFHNWDLAAMLPAVLGLLAFERGADCSAGGLLGLGAAAKVFPGLMVPSLAARRWFEGDRRGALRLVGAAVGILAAANAPVMLVAPHGWSYPLRFQGARPATWGSAWYWLLDLPVSRVAIARIGPAPVANTLSVVALGVSLTVVCVLAARRRLDGVAIGAATVGVFLLTNKVYSPNYDFWLVPFFVLLPVSSARWRAFCVADLAVYVLVIGRFHGVWGVGPVKALLPCLVLIRAGVIVGVVMAALSGRLRVQRAMSAAAARTG